MTKTIDPHVYPCSLNWQWRDQYWTTEALFSVWGEAKWVESESKRVEAPGLTKPVQSQNNMTLLLLRKGEESNKITPFAFLKFPFWQGEQHFFDKVTKTPPQNP